MDSEDRHHLITQLTSLKGLLGQSRQAVLLHNKQAKLDRLHLKEVEDQISQLFDLYQYLNDSDSRILFSKLKGRKILEQINLLILKILNQSFCNLQYVPSRKRKTTNHPVQTKSRTKLFIGFAALGSILAGLSGAAAIQSIVSAFVSIITFPSGLIIGAQVFFAVAAVFAFYLFELHGIAKSLSVQPFELGFIFHHYEQQSHYFKENFRYLDMAYRLCPNFTEHQKLDRRFATLKTSYSCFESKIKEAEDAKRPSTSKNIAQKVLTVIGSLIFGILAALGAQPVLEVFLPMLIGTAVASGPIGLLITGVAMGLCVISGAALFIFFEQKGEKLVNKVSGTPTKAIDKLLRRRDKIDELISSIEISKRTNSLAVKKQPTPFANDTDWSLKDGFHETPLPTLYYPPLRTSRKVVNQEEIVQPEPIYT